LEEPRLKKRAVQAVPFSPGKAEQKGMDLSELLTAVLQRDIEIDIEINEALQ